MIAKILTESSRFTEVKDPARFYAQFNSLIKNVDKRASETKQSLDNIKSLVTSFELLRDMFDTSWWFFSNKSPEGYTLLFLGGAGYHRPWGSVFHEVICFSLQPDLHENKKILTFVDSIQSAAYTNVSQKVVMRERQNALIVFKRAIRCNSKESVKSAMESMSEKKPFRH